MPRCDSQPDGLGWSTRSPNDACSCTSSATATSDLLGTTVQQGAPAPAPPSDLPRSPSSVLPRGGGFCPASLQAGRGVLVVREEWSSEPIRLCVTPGKCPRGQAPQPPLPRIGAGPVRQASRPIAEIGIEYSLRVSLPEHTRLLMLCEAVILCRCLRQLVLELCAYKCAVVQARALQAYGKETPGAKSWMRISD